MSKLDKDEVLANFTAAYQAANGKAPQIEAKGGWYSVDGGKNVRLAALVDLTAELSGGEAKAPEAAPAAKEKPKKAAKKAKKATVTVASSGFNVVSAGSGMKPGDHWKEQIGEGSILPRGLN